ncbi:exocyst complex component Sec6-domain-containing protein [Tribonema minus]|uniref:Exocyst complex component Sec6-domain-containing protein n=1 Tax=Tribonema minus TaxID=303371 RepID=A0A835YNU2_9STRA|nr:exocyst complex component Sec6-domain-containing protein [Tribonema minus]
MQTDEMQTEYRRKLMAMEGQLSSVVRSRLDGVKRARDLISQSAAHIGELHNQFGKMEHLSRDCRGLFGKYERIKSLHHARRNLSVTAHLVEFYYTIPRKARALMDLLQDQPAQLKYVSEETTKLEHWRSSFLDALKEYGDKAMTRATFQKGKGGADPLKYQLVVEKVGPQLSVVKDLSEAVRAQIVLNIGGHVDSQGNWQGGGCLELAMTDPAMLVRTLEVAELISARAKRAYLTAREDAERKGIDPDDAVAGLEPPETMKEAVLSGLKTGLEHKIVAQFSQMQMASVDAGDSQMMATLGAATNLLVDLESVSELVVPCFPPHYEILKVFRTAYEGFLNDLLYPLVSSQERIDTYDVKDMLEAIKWLEYYVSKVEHNDKFAKAIVDLNSMYLKRIKAQIMKWVHNLKAQEPELIQSSDGKWLTTFPDDMFNLVNVQISVAKTLPETFLGEVLLACLEVLHDIQAESMDWINSSWEQVSQEDNGTELLCSLVNDNLRLQGKMDEVTAVGTVSGGYIEVAMLATSKIAASIISVLEGADITSNLFTPEWEDGSLEGVKSVVETHGDFFRDLELWLPDFFFVKLVRSSLDLVVKMYVEQLAENPAQRKPFVTHHEAMNQIDDDVALMCAFFQDEKMPALGLTLGEILEQAGITGAGAVQVQFQMVYDMLAVLAANTLDLLQVSTTQASIKRLVVEFKGQGLDLLMHLIALQGKWTSEERAARREFLERLVKTCGTFGTEVSARFELRGYALPVAAAPAGSATPLKKPKK